MQKLIRYAFPLTAVPKMWLSLDYLVVKFDNDYMNSVYLLNGDENKVYPQSVYEKKMLDKELIRLSEDVTFCPGKGIFIAPNKNIYFACEDRPFDDKDRKIVYWPFDAEKFKIYAENLEKALHDLQYKEDLQKNVEEILRVKTG